MIGRVGKPTGRYSKDEEDYLNRLYENHDFDTIRQWQLAQFNKQWQIIAKCVPFYRERVNGGLLPDKFESWGEFLNEMPITKKAHVQADIGLYSDLSKAPQGFRTTGGSTASPVRIPYWRSENSILNPIMWQGRSWYGINNKSRLFLIWGHSHLLGTGVKGKFNSYLRVLKDRIRNYYRFSAYDVSDQSMRQAAEELIKFKPDYLIGYSSALAAFANANQDRKKELGKLNLKVVIGTAESFPDEYSVEKLQELFGCSVAMEYGASESGVIAHTCPAGGYRAFFSRYFLEAIEANDSGGRVVRISSLFPRCLPLIRYEIGDEIVLNDNDQGIGVVKFKAVLGRLNDYVITKSGTKLHSELFTHAIRDCKGVSRYQVVQSSDSIKFCYTSTDNSLDEESVKSSVKHRLLRIDQDLENVDVIKVSALTKTVAGKTPMVLRT